jgi:hypothetical protein
MSNKEYRSDLDVFVSRAAADKSDSKIEAQFYIVESFEGGSGGKIDFRATNDTVIAAEMERIQAQKKVALYLNSRVTLTETSKLIELAKSDIKSFSVVFRVSCRDQKTGKTLSAAAILADAVFLEIPIPVGGTPPSLKINLSLTNVRKVKRVGDEISAAVRNFRQKTENVAA